MAPSQPPSLNVYQKIAVIRRSSDTLNYEDADGNVKTVSVDELGDAISRAVRSMLQSSRNLSILFSFRTISLMIKTHILNF